MITLVRWPDPASGTSPRSRRTQGYEPGLGCVPPSCRPRLLRSTLTRRSARAASLQASSGNVRTALPSRQHRQPRKNWWRGHHPSATTVTNSESPIATHGALIRAQRGGVADVTVDHRFTPGPRPQAPMPIKAPTKPGKPPAHGAVCACPQVNAGHLCRRTLRRLGVADGRPSGSRCK